MLCCALALVGYAGHGGLPAAVGGDSRALRGAKRGRARLTCQPARSPRCAGVLYSRQQAVNAVDRAEQSRGRAGKRDDPVSSSS